MADINITVDSSQVKVARQELKELANQSLSALRATKQLSSQGSLDKHFANIDRQISRVNGNMSNYSRFTSQAASNSGKFGVVTQQAGYQVGDFLVQVQSGTNWMVAFGQQATQLVGVLPMMTGAFGLSSGALIALSAGLGIVIPLLTAIGAAFMRTGEDSSNASEGLNRYQQALEGVKGSLESVQTELNKLQFGEEDPAIANARKALEEAQNKLLLAQSSQRRIGSAIVPTSEELGNLKQATIEYYDLARLLADLVAKRQVFEKSQAIGAQMAAVELGQARAIGQAEKDRVAAGEAIYKGLIAVQSANQSIIRSNNQISETVQTAIGHYANMRTVAAGVANEMSRAASASFALAQQNLAAGGLTYSGRGGNPATVNQKGGAFVYEGPALDASNIPTVTGGGGGAGPTESTLEKLQEQLALEKELLGTSESYQQVRQALGEDFINTSPKIIEGLVQQANEIRELTSLEEERQSLMDSVNGSLESGFIEMVKGTKTVGEAFRSMAAAIIEELFRVLVVQKLVGGITGSPGGTGIAGLFGGKRASGGSMMAGGSYLVGENGPEIVVPRHSGTVVNANQTSGAMAGSGGITVQNNITVTGSDAAMVRQEVAKMIPQITNATKAAVIDAKQRGGQMAAAFR